MQSRLRIAPYRIYYIDCDYRLKLREHNCTGLPFAWCPSKQVCFIVGAYCRKSGARPCMRVRACVLAPAAVGLTHARRVIKGYGRARDLLKCMLIRGGTTSARTMLHSHGVAECIYVGFFDHVATSLIIRWGGGGGGVGGWLFGARALFRQHQFVHKVQSRRVTNSPTSTSRACKS